MNLCVCVVSALAVSLSIDGALVEGHDVLSESSSLVTEDVFNLKGLNGNTKLNTRKVSVA